MTISLRIIGLFFGEEIDLVGPQPVLTVLNAAKQAASSGKFSNISKFDFGLTGGPNVAVNVFSVVHTAGFIGPISHHHYDPGDYTMADNTHAKPVFTVWQYYVLNSDGTNASTGVKYLNDPAAIVPADGSLIWRLVSICGVPGPVGRASRARFFEDVNA